MPNCKPATVQRSEPRVDDSLGLKPRTRREKVLLHIIDALQRENQRLSHHRGDPTSAMNIDERATLRAQVDLLERDLIITSLARRNGVVSATANELGITERMVRYKMQKLNIEHDTLFKKRQRKKAAP